MSRFEVFDKIFGYDSLPGIRAAGFTPVPVRVPSARNTSAGA